MTVREMMQFLSQFDGDDKVVVCDWVWDWEIDSAVRVFAGDKMLDEMRWTQRRYEDEDED